MSKQDINQKIKDLDNTNFDVFLCHLHIANDVYRSEEGEDAEAIRAVMGGLGGIVASRIS